MSKLIIINPDRRPSGLSVRSQNWETLCKLKGMEFETIKASMTLNLKSLLRNVKYIKYILKGQMALEALLVDFKSIIDRLNEIKSQDKITKITVLTQRAFNPDLLKLNVPMALDYVDLLSISYKQRSAIAKSPIMKMTYKALSGQSKRFEMSQKDFQCFLSNPIEADKVSARYMPNFVQSELIKSKNNCESYRWEIIFMGSLDYLPNIHAIRVICESIIPGIRIRLNDVSVCIAGRRPTNEVKNLCKLIEADLVEDFREPQDVLCISKLALSPVYLASGFQNKILEAAALAIPQLISSNLLAPFRDVRGMVTAESDVDFINKSVEILTDYSTYKQRATDISAQVIKLFSPQMYLHMLEK